MQQFPYFGNYESANQQSQQPAQIQSNQVGPQDQQSAQPQQQPLGMNGSNLAIYSSATMPSLSVLAATQAKHEQQQPMGVPNVDLGAHGKPKRKQVKNACVNCQKACKKCDDGRPCQRCIKYGITDTCVNSVRKQRKKGIKRGPYKKRNKTGENSVSSGASTPNVVSPMTNANIYAQNNGVRANTMPIHYQPFSSQPYDPYAYANNGQMMPQAYMVPTGIPQMYPSNPSVLSYQSAVSLIPPQQQQQAQPPAVNNGFVPQEEHIQQQSPNVHVASANASTNASNNPSAAGTPTPVASDEKSTLNPKTEDDDDEKSKLTILSQLCSAVLDSNGNPKQEETTGEEQAQPQNTPPTTLETSQEENLSGIGSNEQV